MIVAVLSCLPNTLKSQSSDDLRIYGYVQTLAYYQQQSLYLKPFGAFTGLPDELRRIDRNRSTFSLQQLNVFLNKPFAERFNAFVNMEFSLSYSSQRGWGSFSIEEAWVNYAGSDALNVKVGLLLPTFNNLNELKNRTPLLPYLFRPPVYETMLAQTFAFEDFLPERAFVQVYGFVPLGAMLRIDYAVHAGNAETSYIGNRFGTVPSAQPGEDESPFKAFGGRVGLRDAREGFKIGISATYDRDNRRDSTVDSFFGGFGNRGVVPAIPALGDVPRIRFGADVSFTVGNFAFESEYIGVFHDVQYPSGSEANLNKFFFYGNALYNFTEQVYGYALYGFINQERSISGSPDGAGYGFVGIGGGYRINDNLVAKLQYVNARLGANPYADFALNFYFVGLSVIF
jgi:hypothetical protein